MFYKKFYPGILFKLMAICIFVSSAHFSNAQSTEFCGVLEKIIQSAESHFSDIKGDSIPDPITWSPGWEATVVLPGAERSTISSSYYTTYKAVFSSSNAPPSLRKEYDQLVQKATACLSENWRLETVTEESTGFSSPYFRAWLKEGKTNLLIGISAPIFESDPVELTLEVSISVF